MKARNKKEMAITHKNIFIQKIGNIFVVVVELYNLHIHKNMLRIASSFFLFACYRKKAKRIRALNQNQNAHLQTLQFLYTCAHETPKRQTKENYNRIFFSVFTLPIIIIIVIIIQFSCT